MLDTTDLGKVAAELMDVIAERYGDNREARLGVVAVVAEIDVADTDDEPGFTTIEYRCSDSRRWIQAALFEHAKRGVYASSETPD